MTVSPLRLIAYATGGISVGISQNVTAFYLNIFLLTVALLPPNFCGHILLISKVFDAITDPLIGILSDRISTRFGRRRPWLFFSTPMMAVLFLFLFQTHLSLTETEAFGYYLVMFCCLVFFQTCYAIPYASLTMAMGDDDKTRVKLTFSRVAAMFISILIGLVIVGVLLGVFAPNETREELIKAYSYSGYTGAIVILVLGYVATFTSFEPKDSHQGVTIGFFKGLALVLKNKSYRVLIILSAGCFGSLSLVQNNLLIYAEFALNLLPQFTPVMCVLIVCTVLCLFLWSFIIEKKGKKFTFYMGTISLLITYILLFFLPQNNLWMAYIVAVQASIGLSVISFIPYAMLPDVIDLDEITTDQRREGIFFAYIIFIEKISTGITLAISNYALELAGFDSNLPEQGESVQLTIRIMISFLPAAITLISSIVMIFYPISTEIQKENSILLIEKRSERKVRYNSTDFFQKAQDNSSTYEMDINEHEDDEIIITEIHNNENERLL